ncbi:MAG: PorP/SprF family type IX secretion system membrane protein, partial [Saprospiraceae bacterium]
VLFLYVPCLAQQLPSFSLYREYQSFLNPAAVPHDYFKDDINAHIGISYRSQWEKFGDGAPVTGLLNGTYISDQSTTKLILGGSFLMDRTGPVNYYDANAKFGVMFSEDPLYGGFSAALTLGYKQLSLQTTKLIATDITEILGNSDRYSTSSPDIGIGFFYHGRLQNEDHVYIGGSMPQLFSVNGLSSNVNRPGIKAVPHFYGLAGYIKYLNDYSFLETTSWIKYVQNTPINVDLNLKYQLDQTLWLGFGLSSTKIFHAEAGIVLSSNIGWETPIRIGYSFEDGFTEFANPFGMTHEISISFAWDTRR